MLLVVLYATEDKVIMEDRQKHKFEVSLDGNNWSDMGTLLLIRKKMQGKHIQWFFYRKLVILDIQRQKDLISMLSYLK